MAPPLSLHSSHLKANVGAVVEGAVTGVKAFSSQKFLIAERVAETKMVDVSLALSQRRTEAGIAVAGQHDFPRLEVEGDGADVGKGDWEPVDDGVVYVLTMHRLNHSWNNGGTGCVVG